MVKSLLSESNSQFFVYSTSACLPSVATSFLKVVNSSLNFSETRVTVPCLTPVSTTLKLVFLNLSLISSVLSIVAMSMSSITLFDRYFLTQPPTNLAETISFEKPFCNVSKTNFSSLFL